MESSRWRNVLDLLEWCRQHGYQLTNVEWRLLQDCLDSKYDRFSDGNFLLGFCISLPFRLLVARRGARFLERWFLPFYGGLLFREIGKAEAIPAPALNFWNAVVVLQSPLGDAAQRIFKPDMFYTVVPARTSSVILKSIERDGPVRVNLTSTSTALADKLYSAFTLLTLQRSLSETFAGSCLGHSLSHDVSLLVRLRLNTRFFCWNLLTITRRDKPMETVFDLQCPPPEDAPEIWRSDPISRCEVMGYRSTALGRLWWWVHLSLLS
jgi:hypothetical protein